MKDDHRHADPCCRALALSEVVGGTRVTAFVRKAIAEQTKDKTSAIVLPVFDYVTMLLDADAEIRPLGRETALGWFARPEGVAAEGVVQYGRCHRWQRRHGVRA